MKLKEIHRTATFAWSSSPSVPLLATGTVAGALDASFSNDSSLEIWEPDFMDRSEYELGGEQQKGPKASVKTSSRFNRIAWGLPNNEKGHGIIAAGMENGELCLWDPEKILATSDSTKSLILRNTTHQGSVRGLDFNLKQTNLLSSGALNGEIYIWDLNEPSKPYSPGTRSTKLDEITALAWNRQVGHVLASSSSTGYTVVWDLRNKREVVALQYGGMSSGMHNSGVGGRTGMSDVAWHPDNATKLVTASEDDNAPVVMVWDLRNARAPEKLLSGHEKGILSLSWCRQDADLLLSCGKDNRALCWNPQSAEVIGELPYADNWAFQVQWCPRNPDLLATAYFDGTIGVHSLQSTNESADGGQNAAPTPKADGSDVFDVPGFSRTTQSTLSLKQPPKWLRRPTSSSFGYGGKLISVSNLPSTQGSNQSSVVHIRKLVTEPTVVDRAKSLQAATDGKSLEAFAHEKAKSAEAQPDVSASWKALSTLFTANSRDELVALLGFSKAESATRVADAVEKINANVTPTIPPSIDIDFLDVKPHEPMVSFAEPEASSPVPETDEQTPSEQSTSVTSDMTQSTKPADGESTTTVPSLFDDDEAIGTPQLDAEADFFSSMGTIRNALPEHNQIPHQNYAHDSSVAATVGSRPSSSASEVMKNNTFKIYPSDESDIDRLVTKSLILGDFSSAVALCLSAERYADAVLLAVRGGPELLQRTQKAYFEKRTFNLPYLRLFQSIVTEDLDDIVQNADLKEWQEIFVILCTFAKADEFSNLAEQLGQRLEFQASLMKNMESSGSDELRKNATLAYLAAGRLEKVVNVWIEEMNECEEMLLGEFDEKSSSRYSAHAHALQTFMEKVAVFRSATKYVDADLNGSQDNAAIRTYKLSRLYERYFEYADLLASQGLLDEAASFLKLVPSKYESHGNSDFDFTIARERLLSAAGEGRTSVEAGPSYSVSTLAASGSVASGSNPSSQQQSYQDYVPQRTTTTTTPARSVAPVTQGYAPYNTNGSAVPSQASNPYAPSQSNSAVQQPYQRATPMQPYGGTPYGAPGPYNASAQAMQMAAPPGSINSAMLTGSVGPPPPPKKKDDGGWNDAPMVAEKRAASTRPSQKPGAIASPFPNVSPSPGSGPASPAMIGQTQALPPPPRPGSAARGSSQAAGGQLRPPPGAPYGPQGGFHPPPPPSRTFSPSQAGQQGLAHGPPPQRQPSQFAPPPQGRAMSPAQTQPPPRQPPPGGPMISQPPSRAPRHASSHTVAGGGSYAQPAPPATWSGTPSHIQQGQFPPPSAPQNHMNVGPSGPTPPPPLNVYSPPPLAAPRQPPPPGPGLGIQHFMERISPGDPATPPQAARSPPVRQGPPAPKYPPGDRAHIPESSKRIYSVLLHELDALKQASMNRAGPLPPLGTLERSLNKLFDALNCETLGTPVIVHLSALTDAIAARDKLLALNIHSQLLQEGAVSSRPGDNFGTWSSAIRQLIMQL